MVESVMPANLGDNVAMREGYTFSLSYGQALDTLVSIYRMREKDQTGKWPLVLISEDGDTFCIGQNKLGFPIIADMAISHAVDLAKFDLFKKRWRIDVVNAANSLRYKLRLPPVFFIAPSTISGALKDYQTFITIYSDPPEGYTGDMTAYKVGKCTWDGDSLIFNGEELCNLHTDIYYSHYSDYNKLEVWIRKENLLNYKEETK